MPRKKLAAGSYKVNPAHWAGADHRHIKVGYYVRRVGQDGPDPVRYVTLSVSPTLKEDGRTWQEKEREAQARAAEKAKAILEEDRRRAKGGPAGRAWLPGDKVCRYVREVSLPAIAADYTVRDSTRERYRLALGWEGRDSRGHSRWTGPFFEAFRGLTIEQFLDVPTLAEGLADVAANHGLASAKRLRSVMSKYVFGMMETDGLAPGDPLRGRRLTYQRRAEPSGPVPEAPGNHGTTRRAMAVRAGELGEREVPVVSPADRARVVRWLLDDDAEEFASHGRHGGQTREQVAAGRRRACDLALLQATCGLRIHEALTLTAGHVSFTRDGIAVIEVTDDNSKTHRGRCVPMVDPVWREAVSGRLRERVAGLAPGDHVFGAAKTPGAAWEYRNAHKVIRRLYDEMADVLGIDVLRHVSSHVWRASLNTEYLDPECPYAMPEALRVALFGHTRAVNADYYTARWAPEKMLALVTERGREGDVAATFEPQVYEGGRRSA